VSGIGDFPISEEICKRNFSLPMHPYLAEEEQQKIAGLLPA
jgi:dTDP-4-amino-4,6-dideoxygalactose transaminase